MTTPDPFSFIPNTGDDEYAQTELETATERRASQSRLDALRTAIRHYQEKQLQDMVVPPLEVLGRPVTEAWVRKAYERQVQRAAELARQDAEWQRAREQRSLTPGEFRSHEGLGDDDDEGDPF